MPNIAKGTHVLHPGQAKSKQGQKKITGPTDSDTIATPPTTFTAVVDSGTSQSMATTSANLDMQMTPLPDATSSRVLNPNSIPPSTPSSYLPPPSTASVGSGAMTSVSQKWKTPSTTGSAAVSQTLKRSHPVSAAAQLKAERDAMHPMLQKMTTFLDNAGPSVFQPIMLDSLGLTLLCLLYFAPI